VGGVAGGWFGLGKGTGTWAAAGTAISRVTSDALTSVARIVAIMKDLKA
jgi:hypothetical protein